MKRYIIPFVVVSCTEVVTEVDGSSDEVGTDVSSDIGYILWHTDHCITLEQFQFMALFCLFRVM